MSDFFDDMAAMARDILLPSDQGGLGAKTGAIKFYRLTASMPVNPWDPPSTPTKTELTGIRAQAFGIGKELVGTAIENTVLVATDLKVVCERISGGRQPTDVIEIDGKPVTILAVKDIPEAGTVSAHVFFVRA